jgi:hypothetical protein
MLFRVLWSHFSDDYRRATGSDQFPVLFQRAAVISQMGGCSASAGLPDVMIDLTRAAAADRQEEATCSKVHSDCLGAAEDLLTRYAAYHDCQQLIAVAISNASPANVDAAWAAVVPNVQFQAELFDFAQAVADAFQSMVRYIMDHTTGPVTEALSSHQLAAKRFAELYDAIFRFDETTAGLPKLLGDMSFFRRTSASRGAQGDPLLQKTNEMTMFFAVQAPLLTKVINTMNASFRSSQETAKLIEIFAGISDAFTATQSHHSFPDKDLNQMCFRTITGAILCCDAVSPAGAFHAKAAIRTVSAIEILALTTPKQVGLLNLIKFNSKHYKDPTTLKQITKLVG